MLSDEAGIAEQSISPEIVGIANLKVKVVVVVNLIIVYHHQEMVIQLVVLRWQILIRGELVMLLLAPLC